MAHTATESRPHIALCERIDESRPRGRPRKKWLDSAKEDCVAMDFNLVEATQLVEDTRCWRETVWLPARDDFVVIAVALSQVQLARSLRAIFQWVPRSTARPSNLWRVLLLVTKCTVEIFCVLVEWYVHLELVLLLLLLLLLLIFVITRCMMTRLCLLRTSVWSGHWATVCSTKE